VKIRFQSSVAILLSYTMETMVENFKIGIKTCLAYYGDSPAKNAGRPRGDEDRSLRRHQPS
jgi:hypothetical protein